MKTIGELIEWHSYDARKARKREMEKRKRRNQPSHVNFDVRITIIKSGKNHEDKIRFKYCNRACQMIDNKDASHIEPILINDPDEMGKAGLNQERIYFRLFKAEKKKHGRNIIDKGVRSYSSERTPQKEESESYKKWVGDYNLYNDEYGYYVAKPKENNPSNVEE